MQQGSVRYQNGIGILKSLCAFLVVWIHMGPKGAGDPIINSCTNYIDATCRVAVPIFFMITGLFYNPTKDWLKKLLPLTVFVSILYIFVYIGSYGWNIFINEVSLNFILKFIFINSFSPFGVHLWYLYALIYSLLFIKYIHRYLNLKSVYILAIILYIIGIILNYTEYSFICRSWIFIGIPSLATGIALSNLNNLSTDRIPYHLSILKGKSLMIGIIIFSCLVYGEVWLRNNSLLTELAGKDLYFFTLPLAACLIQYFRYLNPNNSIANLFTYIGKNLSRDIYLYHLLIYEFIQSLFQRNSIYLVLLRPFIIILASSLLAIIIKYFIKNISLKSSLLKL